MLNTYSKKLENIEALNYQWVTDSLERYFRVTNLRITNALYSINWNGERRYCCQLWDPNPGYNISVLYSSEIENGTLKYSPDNIINDYPQLISKVLSIDYFREFLANDERRKISIIYDDTSSFTNKTKENILRDHPEYIDFSNSLFIAIWDENNSLSNWIILPDNCYFLWMEL